MGQYAANMGMVNLPLHKLFHSFFKTDMVEHSSENHIFFTTSTSLAFYFIHEFDLCFNHKTKPENISWPPGELNAVLPLRI